jgi:hypothetical protein
VIVSDGNFLDEAKLKEIEDKLVTLYKEGTQIGGKESPLKVA